LCLHQSSSPSYTLFKLRRDFFFFFFFLGILFGIIHFLLCTSVSSSAAEFCSSSVLFVESYLLFVCLLDCKGISLFCGLKLPISSDFFFRCCILVVVLLRVLRLMKSTTFFFDRIFLPCNFSTASESVFIALSLDDSSRFFPSPNVAAPVQERSASCAAR
jgi:hypothetical protein